MIKVLRAAERAKNHDLEHSEKHYERKGAWRHVAAARDIHEDSSLMHPRDGLSLAAYGKYTAMLRPANFNSRSAHMKQVLSTAFF